MINVPKNLMTLMTKNFDVDIKTAEGNERALNWTITTTIRDRAGDIIEAKGAKLANFKKNPVVLLSHDYRGLAIARAENLEKSDDKIMARVVFPPEGDYPLADTVYKLYKGKFMRACSIGFIPIESEDIVDVDDGDKSKESYRASGRRIKTWELIEFSACAVGMNPNALDNQKMMAKGIDLEPLKEAGFIENEKIETKGDEEKELEDDNEKIEKIEETEDSIRIPAKGEEGKHKGHKIRWITVSDKEGIKGIYCIDCKKIITFVFDKKKGWNLEKAKAWMAKHEKDIKDTEEKVLEIDELKLKVEKLEKDIEDLELKSGAVLNAKNKQNLKDAQAKIQEVLDTAEPAEEDSQENDENNEKNQDVIELEDNIGDDDVDNKTKDEEDIEIDDELISKVINEEMDYLMGKVKSKSYTKENKIERK